MPVAAALRAFFVIALPLAICMGIWSVLTLARVLFPPRPLPPLPRVRPLVAGAMRVSAREIGEALRRRYIDPAVPQHHPVANDDETDLLADDLWMRRN